MDKFTATALVQMVATDGGFSFNPVSSKLNPTTGYMVSHKGYEQTISIFEFDEDLLNEYYDKHKENVNTDTYIGAWLDGDKVCLDLSVCVFDLERAIELGMMNDQKAIYDCENKRSIYLPEQQKSGTMTQQQTYMNIKVRELLSQYK